MAQLSNRVRDVFKELGSLECNIYCSKSDDNFKKLGNISGMFKEEPVTGEYKKFNVYTSKYFEAFDLKDPNATIILITDINAKHTKVGITNKGFQAIGRLRSKPHRIIHFTNHSDLDYKRDLKYFKRKHTIYARDVIKGYHHHISRCKVAKLKPYPKFKNAVEDYAEVAEDGLSAEYEIIKVDQLANHDASNEEYNNMQYIQEAWEACNYNVEKKRIKPSTIPQTERMTVKDQIKEALERIRDLEENKANMLFDTDYLDGLSETRGLNQYFELAYKAYHNLGLSKIQDMDYDSKKVKNALYLNFENIAKVNAKVHLERVCSKNRHYSNKELKVILQGIYEEIDYRSKQGGIKKATASQIEDYTVNWRKDKWGYHLAPDN